VTNCAGKPVLHLVSDPAGMPWREISQVAHYRLSVDALTKPGRGADA